MPLQRLPGRSNTVFFFGGGGGGETFKIQEFGLGFRNFVLGVQRFYGLYGGFED